MDKQQQVRINFLDEAEDCFDRIESVLLGLSATVANPQQLDLALRAAHSVKGGAGMMGFLPLSRIAHHLEDFFKILRVRYHSTQIDMEVETLLLQGVDSLRQVSDLHRQGTTIEDAWLIKNINPIFDRLRQHLGELQDEDENILFAQSEDADPSLLMFEEGVETILDEFEQQLDKLSPMTLAEALIMASEKMLAFGRMADLEPFIQLCESIQQQATTIGGEQLNSLTQQALTLWRRSHALVVRGSLEKLPSQLEGFDASADGAFSTDELSSLDNAIALELLHDEAFANCDRTDEAEFNLANTLELAEELAPDFDLFAAVTLESEVLAELQSAFADKISSVELENPVTPNPETVVQTVPIAAPAPRQTPKQTGKIVRVPVEQLYQFNTLLGKLVLERNRVNLRLEQLKNFAALMRQRMKQLEESNTQLRKWYDRASLERIVPETGQPVPSFSINVNQSIANSLTPETRQGQFDALEMDRYSDLHLISQAQIETIVQLDEVTADIELGLQEISQAIQELNQTTRSLQGNITRTQMLTFADVVKSFPRLIRDLSLQFGKQVNLKIEGETTLIDRAILETLNAPLIHLIRNAFDHGIEAPATRIAAGKSPEGTITLQAVNRGTQTIIAIRDDGGGIQLDKIRDRLRQMSIPDEQIQQMSEAEILDYIFQPGFSTCDRVTELSGRGVGMDVVRTNLQEIRGDIRVQTQKGRGTSFTLTAPFTLSILRVMILERSGIVFAVPVNSVRELLRLQAEEGSSVQDLERLTWQKQTIPLVRLEESFTFNRPCKPFEMSGNAVINKPTALVVGEGNSIGGVQIDRVWGEQEVTIRSIDSPLPLPMGFISSMVLGDGRVIPLVDPVQILQGCLESDRTQDRADLIPTNKDRNGSVTPEKVNTILVVDDSINVRRYLALTLEKAGYQVEQAKDGQEALDKLFGGLSVQAVICDIEMPRLDGYGVLEEIKAKTEFQSLPITMLTSRSNEKHRKLAMNLGASAYFSKPYNEQELLQKIGELVGNI
jgi:two-component system, chemotaxis family, sensor histidine kinase and response regulator PixL